jgi:hypothetical protein
MKEAVIQAFFAGRASAQELAAAARGAFEKWTNEAGTRFAHMRAIPGEKSFLVTPDHLVRVLEAVDDGALDLDALDAVCFAVEASDGFAWDADETEDGRRVAEALFILGSPEVNYPITPVVLRKVRHLLTTGESTFEEEDFAPPGPRPYLISERSWERAPDV